MHEREFAEELMGMLSTSDDGDFLNQETIRRVERFDDVGMLTRDAGLVVTMRDGSEFQVTIVKSREPRD